MTDTDQALGEVEALVSAVARRDYGAVSEVVQSAGGWKLAVWCAEVLAAERQDLAQARAVLKESQEGALQEAAVIEQNARREERAAADEVRLENAELVKEVRALKRRLTAPGEIHPVGMTIGRAYEIAVESAERRSA